MKCTNLDRIFSSQRKTLESALGGAVFIALALCLLSACRANSEAQVKVQIQANVLEARLAETGPGPNLVEAMDKMSNRRIYLHQEAVITDKDIAEAHVLESGGHYSVAMQLTPGGTERIARASKEHTGKPLAILAGGEVVAVLTIRTPVNDKVLITGGFTREQAASIAVRVH
jgi:preprotein translocase subunit SecD